LTHLPYSYFFLQISISVYDTFEDSLYHIKAKNLLDDLDEWIIPTIVIHEYVWVMKSLNVSVEDTIYKVEEYVNHHKTKLVFEGEYILRALKIINREKISLSRYNDKIILSVATKFGVLATFDDKLRKQSKKMEVKILPTDISQ